MMRNPNKIQKIRYCSTTTFLPSMTLMPFWKLTDNDIDRLNLNLLPHMLLNVWLVGEVFIQLFTVLELHDEHGPFHLSSVIKQTTGTNDVLSQTLHAFQMTRANLHPLIQHSFAVVGSYYKLFHNA